MLIYNVRAPNRADMHYLREYLGFGRRLDDGRFVVDYGNLYTTPLLFHGEPVFRVDEENPGVRRDRAMRKLCSWIANDLRQGILPSQLFQ